MKYNAKQLIGRGLQFKVYKIGKRRVFKIRMSRAEKMRMLKVWAKGDVHRLERVVKEAIVAEKITDTSLGGLQKIIGRMDTSIIGNPLLNRHYYEQDFAIPLGIYFKKNSFPRNKKAIQGYIDNVFATWRYGFADIVFNFTVNNGISDNSVILLDLGELSFSKAKIRSLIVKKKWLTQWSYLNMHNKKLQTHFRKVMISKVTVKNLDRYWKQGLRPGGKPWVSQIGGRGPL